jgi:hypothetical protein
METFQIVPMSWVYVAILGALIWSIWGRSEDDIMF